MPGELSATYASPGLRWSLLLEDHPGATYEFELVKGTELNIPEAFGGAGLFCKCTITFPPRAEDEHPMAPVTAWKPVKTSGTPDEWLVTTTKTLGRSLKKAGYPDDLTDLKAVILWRQREAEIRAISTGMQPLAAIGAGNGRDLDRALEAAASAEHADDDDRPASRSPEQDPGPENRDPSPELLAEMKKAIGALGPKQVELRKWCEAEQLSMTRPNSEADALAILDRALTMAAEAAETSAARAAGDATEDAVLVGDDGQVVANEPPAAAEPADDRTPQERVALVVAALDDAEYAAYANYCAEQIVPEEPDRQTDAVSESVLAWLGAR